MRLVKRRHLVLALLAAAAVAAFALASWRDALLAQVPRALGWVEGAGPLAPVLFVALYVAASVTFVPASMFTMAAGALFGLLPGVALVMVAAVLGASACFLIARGAGRGLVERRLGRDRRISAIDRAVGARGFTIVFLLRLTPLLPFSPLNYGLGLTRVRYRDFLAGSVGMVPAVFMYVSAGAAAGELLAVLAGARPPHDASWYALAGLGLLATVVATVYVTRLARQALHAAHVDEPADPVSR
jgi:uncharacterized membrane protein YdjX (TVP38/TMEM64 family)